MHGHGKEAQLSSGWISIGSELSSLNFNSSVKAKQSSAIRYSNVVIKSLCGNLDICLNYYTNAYFRLRNSARVLSVAHREWTWTMLELANAPNRLGQCLDIAQYNEKM